MKKVASYALILVALIWMSAAHVEARRVETGFLNRSLVLEGEEYATRYTCHAIFSPRPSGL
jgi:hypothetical protein